MTSVTYLWSVSPVTLQSRCDMEYDLTSCPSWPELWFTIPAWAGYSDWSSEISCSGSLPQVCYIPRPCQLIHTTPPASTQPHHVIAPIQDLLLPYVCSAYMYSETSTASHQYRNISFYIPECHCSAEESHSDSFLL